MKQVEGLCPNKNCISNYEPIKSKLKQVGALVQCHYCERTFKEEEIKRD